MNFWIKKSSPVIKSIGLTSLLSTLTILIYYLINNISERIGWSISGYVDAVKTPLFSFDKWKTAFSIQTDSFLILEHFVGQNMNLTPDYALLYGISLIIGFSIFLSSISGLTRLWHGISFGVFALLIGTLHLENLHFLESIHDKAFTGIVLTVYICISFYFHFNAKVSLFIRFLTYLFVSGGIISLINTFAKDEYWYVESLSYSFSSLTIITFLFVVFLALCIPFGILYITTFKNTGQSGDSVKHFYVFYIIYLLNLIYVYLNVFHGLDLGLYYFPPILLFVISTLIGLWLITQQDEIFGVIAREESVLFWVYLGSSIIASSTYAYHISLFDTSYVIALEQAITICFIGFGFLMLFYISYNFYDIIKQNLPVYKIAFKPQNIDFLSSWGVGLLITVGLFYINNFTSYRYLWASYYNNLGDSEYFSGNTYLAEERYGMAKMYSVWNLHSNYMLANIAQDNKREDMARLAYDKSSKDEGSQQSFVQMALIDIENKNYLESIITLKKGLEKFPHSKEIFNNLGLAFYRIGEVDSALHYLDQGIQIAQNDAPILESNYLAISALAKLPINDESKYLKELSSTSDLNQTVNQLAYLNESEINSTSTFFEDLVKDSVLNGNQISYIYNYSINNIGKEKPFDLNAVIQEKLKSGHNLENREQLLFSSFVNHYNQNAFYEGRHNLLELNDRYGKTNGYYLFLLGLDALKKNQFQLAVDQLDQAFKAGQKAAAYPLAMAATQLDDRNYVKSLWDFVFKLNILQPSDVEIIKHYLNNIDLRSNEENEYYFQVLLNHKNLSITQKIEGIKNSNQAEDLIDVIIDHYVSLNEKEETKKFILQLSELELSNKAKAKCIEADYLLGLNLKNTSLWVDQLDINNVEGKLYSDIFKGTNFLNQKDQQQLYFNSAFIQFHADNLLKEEKTEEAFEFVSEHLQLNPYSEIITNSYLETCFSLGLKDFANSKKVEAEYLLSDEAVKRVNQLYASLLEDYNQRINQWDTLTE
ncbi:M48 family metallopeptidase [Flammeovirga sp. OC4]|uniref:tetratricopeptide repeat protein n=1 Tax=Flammeovirga sp. OC4 TaxID=1382345 RepID=UPI0005C68F5D|nr:hypothetical protein [Flammeovirga sp. OC4]